LNSGRNIYNWAPLEIYYVEWIAELGSQDQMRSDDLPEEIKAKYSEILKRYLVIKGQDWPLNGEPDVYDNPHGQQCFPEFQRTPKPLRRLISAHSERRV
jgi:hypothetical protein